MHLGDRCQTEGQTNRGSQRAKLAGWLQSKMFMGVFTLIVDNLAIPRFGQTTRRLLKKNDGEKKKSNRSSMSWFRSRVLRVMSPARFRCANLLISLLKRRTSYMPRVRPAGLRWCFDPIYSVTKASRAKVSCADWQHALAFEL